MSGSAPGDLVARAFESMLKECSNKKYNALQSSIQTYLDGGKDSNQQSNIGETKQDSTAAPKQSGSFEPDSGGEKNEGAESAAKDAEPTSSSGSTTAVSDSDLVLEPLKLAFETKNTKLVELALDCFHKLVVYNHLEGDPGIDGDKNSKLLTDILIMVCSCVDTSTPDSVTLQVMKVLLTAIASTKVRVHGCPLLEVIKVCFNIANTSKSPINQATARASLTQMLSIIFRQMENDAVSPESSKNKDGQMEDLEKSLSNHNDPKKTTDDIITVKHLDSTLIASGEGIQSLIGGTDIKGLEDILQKAVDLEDDSKLESGTGQKSMSIAQRDALLLFRTLCKMAMKEGNDDFTSKSRILSLELLQGVLADCGVSFTKNCQFVDSLRGHLSFALLRAAVSQSPVLFQHAAGIFSVILLRFRESLKAEIGVFFPIIVLKALDGSDLNQKLVVLRTLEKICKDPQTLVDLYINYDCDNEAPNLFEKMVANLSKIAQGTQNLDPKSSTASQTVSIKISSLQGLVNIVKSLVIWEKGHRKSDNQNEDNKSSEALARRLDGSKGTGESLSNFEGLKVYKSTMEASVSEKLSRSDFIQMSASTAEESAPQELLEEIYDNIVKEELVNKDDSVECLKNSKYKLELNGRRGLLNVLNLSFPRRISSSDSIPEKEAVLNKIHAVIKEQGDKKGVFFTSDRIDILRPMVEVVGWPLLATFSVVMGEPDNSTWISICMEGFKEGVVIMFALGMDTIRYAFLTSLLRYNFLHAPRDMREKNVEALRTLLDLCNTHMYALQDSWLAILECISRLEYIVSCPAMTATIVQGTNQNSRDAILQSLRELSGKATEQVFSNSVKLPSESVVEFFSALCYVSAEELKQSPARTFSLQKIVGISYSNMTRIHMVWARIWTVLAQHFIFAGSHADEKVAIYSIDSLQRLGMKYLEHPELGHFTFQKGILKPFVVLMQSSKSESIRRLILSGIVQIIRSRAGIIKSGWHSIFMIFTMAADDSLEPIVESAFENIEQVILEHFNQVFVDCFMDCVNCLIGFATNKSSVDISLKSIALLRISENRLSEGLVPVGSLKSVDSTVDETCKLAEHYWFPMLSGLSRLISDPRSEVSNCALEVLFDLLNERGSNFSTAFWESIFQGILFPIFDHVRHAGKDNLMSSEDEWLRESTVHALQLLCDLFNSFYKDVCFMLPQLLSLLLDCAKKTDQSVVSIALGALVHLIEVGGHQFTSDDWVTLLKSLKDAVHATQPRELLNDASFENGKHRKVLSGDLDSGVPVSGDSLHNSHDTIHTNGSSMGSTSFKANGAENALAQDQETTRAVDMEVSQGPPSPSVGATDSEVGSLQRSQTFGQKIMGNMRDNLLTRSFTSKPKNFTSDAAVPSSPSKVLFPMQSSTERPPLNLLRQELTATSIYLNILLKTTAAVAVQDDKAAKEEKPEGIAEEKLVSFFEQVLREASDFQSSMEETANMELHRVLELRAPIIVKVMKGMCEMNPQIFKDHLRDFYPYITKLVCSEQMDVRSALADLFSSQLSTMLPTGDEE
ncbi:LOW QUALITY PROTEIN: brefeldin A-inhibited guanine nucleotide-exchange protein 5-like [Salvia hispanica]|uniref:LOW QUALITY PROTEIN: brefeldin A-inhibited guanine nucleotide-exchange protein 5-like n=1 Tax=Salvia hispanica TaxID=49212 RepID=UPI00200969CA|nr:LOW QUALITY PROTEIN: brefeldin A-inhibited guanine nucleotide-exchange protein 5-like [Salvia hispanica]